jgi:GTP-binding protein Era
MGPVIASDTTRFGFAAIIGAPNAGKSTLVNMLVGAKVSIVSHKVQTTRTRVRGIYIEGSSQVALIDTPGIFAPRRRLDRAMVEAAWASVSEADAVALIVDAARGADDTVEAIATRLKAAGGHKLLILNKIDRLASKDALLALAARLSETTGAEEVFMVSALTGDGVDILRTRLAGLMPKGPWHYPEDDITDLPLRMLAAEITREKMLGRLHDELPYAATVETTDWKELRDGSVRIEQTLYVERDGQKKIVLGKGGATIKQISSEARAELKDILGRNVHLFLFVKVRQNWGDDPERYREMGLQFPKD